jgi:hypothetical protein
MQGYKVTAAEFYSRLAAITLTGALITTAILASLGGRDNRFATFNPEATRLREMNKVNDINLLKDTSKLSMFEIERLKKSTTND